MNNIEEILEGCKANNRRAQQLLFKKYYSSMMVVCMRYSKDDDCAKDILQEAFVNAFKYIHKFRSQESSKFKAWLKTIVINKAIDYVRKENRKNELSIKYTNIEDTLIEEEIEIETKIDNEKLIKAIQLLSPRYRAVFNMYVIDGFTHEEISEELGISIGSSKSNLHKARKNIKQYLL